VKHIVKTYRAGGAVGENRIVTFGSGDQVVVQAAAAAAALIGICCHPGGAAVGERLDVVRAGIADVVYGGNVTRGDLLTADAEGRAVAATRHAHAENAAAAYAQNATTAAASVVRVIGTAEVSGVAGDIGQVLIAPGLA
jgi:hypothetical protein